MKILFAVKRKREKIKLFACGNILDLLTIYTVVGKSLVEKLENEKHINSNEAKAFLIDCLNDAL